MLTARSASRRLVPWFAKHARDLPWRRPGFGAWGTLVSEIMLQQTQASRVAGEIDAWLARWPTPCDLAGAPASEVLRQWGTLGYPRRALRLQAAAEAICTQHGGEVPDDLDALLALPGVGEYTARAVLAFHFRQRQPVVDTNVRRVLARAVHGLADQAAPSPRDLADAEALLPRDPERAAIVSAALMEVGAIVCTAKAPRCDACPLAGACAWLAAGRPDNAPQGRAKQARFAGSDRQARGQIMRALRTSEVPVPRETLIPDWPDAAQRERALASLLADGLAFERGNEWSLPE